MILGAATPPFLNAEYDQKLLNKALRVLESSHTTAHLESALKYLRLSRDAVRLSSSKCLLSGWTNDLYLRLVKRRKDYKLLTGNNL